jgi:hypothetical protein
MSESLSEQRGWKADFAWIDVSKLSIDDGYQRSKKSAHISRIAKQFDSRVFGAVSVGRRPDSSLFVIDGQQRLAAAVRVGMTSVPCMVFDVTNDREEASLFTEINKGRKNITPFEQWKADLHAHDPVAIAVRGIVEATGYRVVNGQTDYGVQNVKGLIAEYKIDKDVFRDVWSLLAEIHNGSSITDLMLRAMCLVERAARKSKLTMITEEHLKTIRKLGVHGINNAMNNAVGYLGDNNPSTRAKGIIKAINGRKTKNTLPFPSEPINKKGQE